MPEEIKLPNKRLGYYYIKEKQYVAVTTVLEILNKPALISWAIKETAKAIANHPNIITNESDVFSAVYGTRNKAGERGKTIHSFLEILKRGNPLPITPKEYQGYVQALQSWWNTHNPEILELEKLVYSNKFGYAGTTDLIANINKEIWVIDIKTGKAIYPEHKLQISAYRQCLIEMDKKVDKFGVVLLKEDSNFEFIESENCLEAFLHAKALFEWKNKYISN